MEKIRKINAVLVFLVIVGTIFANINAIVSLMPINDNLENNETENHSLIQNTYEFDIATIEDITSYIQAQSECNEFEISTIVYSAGLLIESDDTLIIIGHGYFDSGSQYCIGDYSANRIIRMADNKEVVALLSCYSSNVKIENSKILTYTDKIDIVSAMNDLFVLLDWTETSKFVPTNNIFLFDLDPGGGGGIPSGAPEFFTSLRYAQHGGYYYWNLHYQSAMTSLSTYMMNNKYRLIEFTFTGTHYVETYPGSGEYSADYHYCTFNGWLSIEGDMKEYVQIRDVIVDGDNQGKSFTKKLEDIMMAADATTYQSNIIAALGIFAGTFVAIGIGFLAAAVSLKIAAGVLATAGTAASTTLASIGWTAISVAGFSTLCACIAIVFIFLAIYAAIAVVVLAVTWI